jgi:hypothetical protein
MYGTLYEGTLKKRSELDEQAVPTTALFFLLV